jgi:hypothetical protein
VPYRDGLGDFCTMLSVEHCDQAGVRDGTLQQLIARNSLGA